MGRYSQVTTSSAKIKLSANGNSIADNSNTTQQITSGAFGAGHFVGTTASTTTGNIPYPGNTECEFCLIMDSALVGDYFEFKMYNSILTLNGYTLIPRLDARKGQALVLQ